MFKDPKGQCRGEKRYVSVGRLSEGKMEQLRVSTRDFSLSDPSETRYRGRKVAGPVAACFPRRVLSFHAGSSRA